MRHSNRTLVALALAASASVAAAALPYPTEALAAAIAGDASAPTLASTPAVNPVPSASLVPATALNPQRTFQAATQTMLWSSRQTFSLGLGVEQRWQAPAWARPPQPDTPDADAHLLLALAWRPSASTRLVWQASSEKAGTPEPDLGSANTMALDLRRNDAARRFARGSLRLELDSGTAIALKPRARQLGLALTRQW